MPFEFELFDRLEAIKFMLRFNASIDGSGSVVG